MTLFWRAALLPAAVHTAAIDNDPPFIMKSGRQVLSLLQKFNPSGSAASHKSVISSMSSWGADQTGRGGGVCALNETGGRIVDASRRMVSLLIVRSCKCLIRLQRNSF
jgi:hypothetical protein